MTCSIDGCEKKVYARGWCAAHWMRWRKYGDTSFTKTPMLGADVQTRFWAKVDKRGPDECWPWLGAHLPTGYGHFTENRKSGGGAYRFAYRFLVGEVPEGLHLDHLCRNRGCCNPAHLEPVTPGENTLRGFSPSAINARKTHCDQGHELSLLASGRRQCQVCRNAYKTAWRAARRAEGLRVT